VELLTQNLVEEGLNDLILIQECESFSGNDLQAACIDGFALMPACVYNGVCSLVSNHLLTHMTSIDTHDTWQMLVFEFNGNVVVFLNVHLPDKSKCQRQGIEIKSILSNIEAVLDAQWVTKSWTQLVFAGDFNISFPSAKDVLGPSCTGLVWCDRCSDI
jgi:exonuclease III